ncbi:hypothetical protein P9112_014201 [Eukaryota sp. TZLM1-RC]
MCENDLYNNICSSAVLNQDLHSLLLEKGLTLRHAMNCSKLITYRSSLHDAVRDTVFNMPQIVRISCIKEPLLKETLSSNSFGSDDRGNVYCDLIENSEVVIDFVIFSMFFFWFKFKSTHRIKFDFLNQSVICNIREDKDIEEANADRNRPLVSIAFPF